MDPLRCMIVDDEPLALTLLEDYISRTPFLSLAAKCHSGVEALDTLLKGNIDVVFMDIQMPQLSGLEVSRMVENCSVIFTTAFEQYAIEGYKVNALDYLLKPFSYAEFLAAANKAVKMAMLQQSSSPKSIVVKSEYRQVVIKTQEITFIEGIGDYIKIHLFNGEVVQTLMTLKSIEELLPKSIFIRVHRSFIVNKDQIKTIERNRIVFGKTLIPISDSYREDFNNAFF